MIMSSKTVKITSNDSVFLQTIYDDFQKERLDISKDESPVKGTMGVDIVLNFNIDLVHIAALLGMVKYCIIDKKCKMFLKKPDRDDKVIDAELLDKPQDIIDLVEQDDNSELYIKKEDR